MLKIAEDCSLKLQAANNSLEEEKILNEALNELFVLFSKNQKENIPESQ